MIAASYGRETFARLAQIHNLEEVLMRFLLALIVLSWTFELDAQDWPREIASSDGIITVYQPQIESYKGNSLSARTAISVTTDEKSEPVFGAVWLDCRVSTDRTSRIVNLEDVTVKHIKFPSGTDQDTSRISAILEDQIPRLNLTFSLDLLLESMETAQKEREFARELEVTPPMIIFRNHPAVLVLIDGDPVLTDVPGTSLKRVTNTPYFLVQVPSTRRFYLRGGSMWYTASQILGPWTVTDNPPIAVADLSQQLASDTETDDELNANDLNLKSGEIPEIIISTTPAELIATDGAIQFSPIERTGLLYASNTPSRVFLEIATQRYFVLLSGRWYSARSLTGAWANIESKKLPADFAKIPPGSECDDVLSSVAGTIPAKEAIYDAQIPQTAEVDRATATTEVRYDGDPQFEVIENTGMEYALNSPTAVIRTGGMFYACEQGVWFVSTRALGPWAVCVNVPEIIYTIPPRYPVYNVRYVRVYGYTPSVAYVGYTAGYTGCYVFGGTVVYGTGYHYRPWYRRDYFARPSTWGFGVRYDSWSGWSFGAAVGWGHPHGWFADNSRFDHAGWWGPVGYRPVYRPAVRPAYREGYHPAYRQPPEIAPVAPAARGITRNSGATRTNAIYGRWNAGVRRPTVVETRPPATITPAPARQPDARPPRTDVRGNVRIQPPPSTKENNVYVAPNGNVLRSTPRGWQQRDRNTWKDAGQAPARQGVIRDQQVRQRAADRSSGFLTLPTATPVVKGRPPQKAQPPSQAPPTRKEGGERKRDEKKHQ